MGPRICSKPFPLSQIKTTQLIRTAALALVVVFSVPAGASAEREVKAKVDAVYPEVAKRLKISGAVQLEATVSPSGKVKDVRTVMGNSVLAEAAKEAVRHWKFAPAAFESIEEVEIVFPQ